MDELFQLIGFLVFFGIWILNAVNQAKKRRQEELDEMFEEFDGEEDIPSSRPAPSRTEPAPSKRTGWEEIQQELKKMLEQETMGGPSQPTAPPPAPPEPKPNPRPEYPTPAPPVVTSRRPDKPQPTREHPKMPPTRVRTVETRKPPTRHTQSKPQTTVSEPLKRQAALMARRKSVRKPRKKLKTLDRDDLLRLHGDPIANAIILGEILRGPRGPMPLCGGIRRSRG